MPAIWLGFNAIPYIWRQVTRPLKYLRTLTTAPIRMECWVARCMRLILVRETYKIDLKTTTTKIMSIWMPFFKCVNQNQIFMVIHRCDVHNLLGAWCHDFIIKRPRDHFGQCVCVEYSRYTTRDVHLLHFSVQHSRRFIIFYFVLNDPDLLIYNLDLVLLSEMHIAIFWLINHLTTCPLTHKTAFPLVLSYISPT